MHNIYPRIKLRFRQTRCRPKLLLKRMIVPLMILFVISVTTTFAQNEMNQLYLSGQITNIESGAPVAGQMVYIESNIASCGGMSFYDIKYTDNYGFFYDTISTTSEKGSLLIYAFDINGDKYETEEFFRFRWEDTYYANIVLPVFDAGASSDMQASFFFMSDTTTNDNLNFYFEDVSTGADIVSWHWSFGDGKYSNERNPNHVYESPGIYDVSLFVSNQQMAFESTSSTITKKIKVGMKDYYHLGGHAFAGYFPVDIGTAFLYKIEEDEFIPIDTVEFDTLGYYFFYQLIEGNYKVKTFPSQNSSHAGSYLPTYFGNSLLWTKAETINLTATAWEYDISMVINNYYSAGSGLIDGVVMLEGKNAVVEDIEIILFNEDHDCLTYIKSDEKGTFEFSGLSYGTYKIQAEVPGMYTYPTSITLSENNPSVEDINILIYNEDIYYGIGNDIVTKLTGLGDPYPNPAQSYVNFKFNLLENGFVQVFILNQNGQVVEKYNKHHQTGENMVQLSTSHLSSGIYSLMVLFENEKHIKSFIKVN